MAVVSRYNGLTARDSLHDPTINKPQLMMLYALYRSVHMRRSRQTIPTYRKSYVGAASPHAPTKLIESTALQDKYVNSTLQQAGNPPLALALMPDGGLGSITQAVVRLHSLA